MSTGFKNFLISLLGLSLLMPVSVSALDLVNLTQAKESVIQATDRRIEMLNTTTMRIEKTHRLNNSFKAELRSRLQAEKENLKTLRTRIENTTNSSSLNSEMRSNARFHNRFSFVVRQSRVATAAEKIVTITAIMSEMGLKLKNRIDAAEANGADTTTLVEALASLSVHIDSANAHAQMAIRTIAELNADRDDTTELRANQAKLKAAREQLRLAHEEVKGGRQDIGTIINGLKRLQQASSGTSEDD